MVKKAKRFLSLGIALSLCASMFCVTPQISYANSTEPAAVAAVGETPATPIYKDSVNYSFAERAADMIAKMSLNDKATQMNSSQSPSITLKDGYVIPTYGWWNEALHGVLNFQYNKSGNTSMIYNATSYPINMSMGNTWDPALMYKVSSKISDEARELAPDSDRMLTFYSPVINMLRDSRWGRAEESVSEDPLLTAKMAGQFVNGLEGKNMDGTPIDSKGYLKAVATIKHYTANNSEVNRLGGNSDVTQRELREYYTLPYRNIIQNSGVTSVMCSYNSVNGIPTALDTLLEKTLLRQTFGLKGYVTTDCDSLAMATDSSRQNYKNPLTGKTITPEEGYAWGAMVGIDLDCNAGYTNQQSYGSLLPGAVSNQVKTPLGTFTENAVDVDLLRLYTTRMKLGEFDDTVRDSSGKIQSSTGQVSWYDKAMTSKSAYGTGWTYQNKSDVAVNITDDRLATAREAASAALVLLKNNTVAANNNKPLLPLSVPTTGDFKVVVYGYPANPNTSDNSFYTGGYSCMQGSAMIAKMVNPYNGISAAIKKINPNATVVWKQGLIGQDSQGNTSTNLKDMNTLNQSEIDQASNYDLAIVCLGTDRQIAGEDTDRGGNTSPNNYLPGKQIDLANAVLAKNSKMVTVIESTSADDISTLSADAPALLWSSFNGMVKGQGLADVLLGNYNPSGRTTTMWFKQSQFPSIRSYRLTPGEDTYKTGNTSTTATQTETVAGRTYMYYDNSKGAPIFPFGYGLSYSNFEYSNMTVDKTSVDPNGTVKVTCDVRNASGPDGNEIVELYASQPDSTKTGAEKRPIKRLIGFNKVMIPAGQTKTVSFDVKIEDLHFYDEATKKYVVDEGRYNLQVSTSSADMKLNKDITVTGTLTPKLNLVTASPCQEGDTALDIPERVIFEKGKEVIPQLTYAMTDDTLYGYINKGASTDKPAGLTVTYKSNRPAVAAVDASGKITTVGGGVATITATATLNGVSKSTDFVVYVKASTALATIQSNGMQPSWFSTSGTNFNVALPAGTNTPPKLTATPADSAASVQVVDATTVPGTTKITVTNGAVSAVYTVNFYVDTTLASVKINGVEYSNFKPNVKEYTLLAPDGMTKAPTVEATATDTLITPQIAQATAIPGTATVTVSSGATSTVYTFNFKQNVAKTDEFDSTTLNSNWSWVNEDKGSWSLTTTPGAMVLTPLSGDVYGTSNNAKNILLQDAPGDWTIETKEVYSYKPNTVYQQGGLMVFVDMDNWIKLEWEAQSGRTIIQDCREIAGSTSSKSVDGSIVPSNNTVWFRIVKKGNTYTSYYSIDGTTYTQLFSGDIALTSPKVGIYANNGSGTTTDLNIAFDYFKINALGDIIPGPIPSNKPFTIGSTGTLTRSAGIQAKVNVSPTAGVETNAGEEVVVFQLMKGTTPVSIVALQKDITSAEDFTAYFNVEPTDKTYTVRTFVINTFNSDPTNAPISLAQSATLN